MTDTTTPPERPDDTGTSPDDVIARLLRLAGPRQAVPEATAARVRSVVHAHWRETTRLRRRQRVFRVVAPAMAAILALALGLGLWMRSRMTSSGEPVATVVRSDG